MIVYHGSYISVPDPDLEHTRKNVDFGPGFYTTPIYEQAISWCGKFKRLGLEGIVSKYLLDDEASENLKILRFDSYSEDWLTYISACRRGEDSSDFDIVSGGVANDKVFNTVELYFDGLIDRSEAIKRLRYEKSNLQICLRTERALEFLHFESSEKI